MTDHAVVALLCPTCGADLSGLDTDAVFGCRECAAAWEPTPAGLQGPFTMAQTDHAAEGPSVTLPFWRFTPAPLLLPEGVSAPPFAYIAAFDIRRRKYFGDPGLRWTVLAASLFAGPPRVGLAGVTTPRRDAERIAYFAMLRAIDIQRDVTGFEFDLVLEEPTLLLVTFADHDSTLRDPVTGESYAAAAFCDLPMLRAASRHT